MIRQYTEAQINRKYREVKKEIEFDRLPFCESCGRTSSEDMWGWLTPSHLISRADSKRYNCVELIWNKRNIRIHCTTCHQHWENGTKKGADFDENMAYISYLFNSETIPNELYQKHLNKWKR